jgi:hypothetical protein
MSDGGTKSTASSIRDKLDKLARLADPGPNDNPHERALASAKLAGFKGRRPPGARPEPPPLPEVWIRKPTAKSAKPKAGAVTGIADGSASDNTTKSKPKPEAIEAINGIIQLAKRMARGFKSFVYFRTAAYHRARKLTLAVPTIA